MGLGSAGLRTFHLQEAVTNPKGFELKRTSMGMWLQAWLDPVAECDQDSGSLHLSTLLSSVLVLPPGRLSRLGGPHTSLCSAWQS